MCVILLNWLSYVKFLFYFLLLKVRHAISSPKISNKLKTKKIESLFIQDFHLTIENELKCSKKTIMTIFKFLILVFQYFNFGGRFFLAHPVYVSGV